MGSHKNHHAACLTDGGSRLRPPRPNHCRTAPPERNLHCRTDVNRLLLTDARIAARITAILCRRLADLEQRLSDSVFKTVAQHIATTLETLAAAQPPASPLRPGGRHPQIALTHEQLAALAGTSRETCTKVLRDYADRDLIRLARGRITVLDADRLKDAAG